ncbi:hypothetical protein CON22_26045 [Bacillus cereus]|nr:hypothetical protein CON22_26045 [Bacillus cereus]
MDSILIEHIYQEILDGKRSRFPPHTWCEDYNRELAKRVTKYLVKSVLNWDVEALKKNWSQKIIIEFKLSGVLSRIYNGSPYAMLDDSYPNVFKEWEFGMTPLNFWTKKKGLEALRWTIEEKEKLTDKQILDGYNYEWVVKQKLRSPCQTYFNSSPYKMINELYPNRFKEWEFNNVTPRKFWTKEKGLEALRWTIEEKEKLTDKQLIEVYNMQWLSEHNLVAPCQIYWNSNAFRMLNDLYSNTFKEWELINKRLGRWTKNKALNALKWTIEEKEKLTDIEIRKIISVDWLKKKGLGSPLGKYWRDSPYKMINDLYPGRFKEWEFNSAPNKFWTKDKSLKALKWIIEEKEKLSDEQLRKIYTRKWLIIHGLQTPLNKLWKNSPYAMLRELYPGKFKEWELNRVPPNFWTKEKALEALKWIIEEKENLTDEQLRKVYTRKWLINHGLRTPLERYWHGSIFKMLNELRENANRGEFYKESLF